MFCFRKSVWVFALFLLTGGRAVLGFEESAISMGEPISAVVIGDAAYGPGANGEPLMHVLVKGPPALFNAIDLRTGERVFAEPLPDTKMTWGMQVGPDGAVYIATNTRGKLFRWQPGAEKVEDLGRLLPGETHLWELAIAKDGKVYTGTYPGGRAVEYDPATGKIRDFGRLAEGADYARGIAVSDEFLFVGTGARVGQLFRIDRLTGEKTEILLPEEANATMVGNLRYRDGLLFTTVRVEGGFLVYDVEAGEWQTHRLTLPSEPGPNGKLYSVSGFLFRMEENGNWESTGFRPKSGGAKSYGWLDLGTPDFPGKTLASTDMRGRYWLFNPETNRGMDGKADVQASPVPIRSTFAGPDGRVYVGGYLSPGMAAAYDPRTEKIVSLPGISQIEGWGAHGDEILIGVYPSAKIYRYDPRRVWDFGRNPKHLFDVGELQDRPFAFASDGRFAAIGTVPQAGQLGGALTIANLETGEREVFRNVVPEQSIVSLVYDPRTKLLVGGSSISGGLGIEPAAAEGELFLWDLEKREKVWSAAGKPGEMGVTGLTLGPDGKIWGVTGQFVFRFDPAARKVLQVENLFPGERIRNPGTEWVNGYLNFHRDGKLYGQARGRIFRMNPENWQVEEILRRASYFAQEPGGDVLFARDAQTLFRLPFEKLR